MPRQTIAFGLVGVLATLTHMVVGGTLIHAGVGAIAANLVAFVVAFFLSFSGHYKFSFADRESTLRTSLGRFALVACAGFLTNQALLFTFIFVFLSSELHAFLVSTGVVALVTFILSKTWAFRNPYRPGDMMVPRAIRQK